MNKRIFCLCFVLIALIGLYGMSACDADNSTVVDSNSELSLVDSVQSVDDGVGLGYDQALAERDDIDSKSEVVDDLNENISQEDCISIPNEDNAPLDGIDESAIDLHDNGFIINAAKDIENKLPNTFIPVLMDKNLFAIDFDPETGIMKVNQNCSYMNTKYINSTAPVRWHVHLDNVDYQKEDPNLPYTMCEIGGAYPTRISEEFNLTDYISNGHLPIGAAVDYYKCYITIDVLDDKNFSVDFKFPITLDDFRNVKYGAMEKSTVHVSGKDIEIFNSKDPKYLLYGSLHFMPRANKIIDEERGAFCKDLVRFFITELIQLII